VRQRPAAIAIWKPTRAEIASAFGRTIPDVIGPGLRVLFCGINPSLYSAAVGHHFARPGNRFWPTLHAAGFTERLLSPFEDATLLDRDYGLTNLVRRATATAEELTPDELAAGGRRLVRLVRRFRPATVALLGVTAYRAAFRLPKAALGLQPERIGASVVWVLPNPSGLNAHYQVPQLARMYGRVRDVSGSAVVHNASLPLARRRR
jgi:double-stranded uracil-DNA glycosylase